MRGKWRYLYRAIDKHGDAVDFMLSAKRNGDAAKRFFRKMLKDAPLLAPDRIGTDGDRAFPGAIETATEEGLLPSDLTHYVTKHLQQGIESDHFRVKKTHGTIRWIAKFQHRPTNDQRVRGYALAQERLWPFGRLDRLRTERSGLTLLRSSTG